MDEELSGIDLLALEYQTALNNIPSQKVEDSESRVMRLLLARGSVGRELANKQPFSPETLHHIVELDQLLRMSAIAIQNIVGPSTLADWRETMQPPASAWWWSLDDPAVAEPKPNPLWGVLAGFFFTVSLSLTGEISGRFLSGGPDFLSVCSTLSQALLALLAASTFTAAGRHWVERMLLHLGIDRKFKDAWKAVTALAVLLVMLMFRFSLPEVARWYNNRGLDLQRQGLLTRSIENYQRAVSLNPDYVEAHYDLATAYEDLLDYDKAITEYQTAIRGNARFYAAHNNLARLYILRRSNYARALKLSTTVSARSRRPSNNESETKSIDQLSFAHPGCTRPSRYAALTCRRGRFTRMLRPSWR